MSNYYIGGASGGKVQAVASERLAESWSTRFIFEHTTVPPSRFLPVSQVTVPSTSR
jgi:hypothetical protein